MVESVVTVVAVAGDDDVLVVGVVVGVVVDAATLSFQQFSPCWRWSMVME